MLAAFMAICMEKSSILRHNEGNYGCSLRTATEKEKAESDPFNDKFQIVSVERRDE
jgi:hypothetical protein